MRIQSKINEIVINLKKVDNETMTTSSPQKEADKINS